MQATRGPGRGRLARHDRTLLFGGLAALVALCWWQLFAMADGMSGGMSDGMSGGMSDGMSDGTVEDAYAAILAMWIIMMVGMMVPTAIRSIMVYVRINAQVERRGGSAVSGYWFATGYLLAWMPFCVAATEIQLAFARADWLSPTAGTVGVAPSGVLLVMTGLWQLSPVKDRCLTHCRSPVEFLAAHFRPGAPAAIGLGIRHGVYCLGCCWLLMSLLFVGGVMSLFTVAAITAFVLMEKLLPPRYPLTHVSAWLLLVSGAACLTWSLIVR